LQVPAMKISPDSGPVSTPDPWPRDAESAELVGARRPVETDAIRTSPIDCCTGQSAEALLLHKVWSDTPGTSRRLETAPTVPLPRNEDRASAVQALTDFIFEPLS
jgi:hypothetical protein